MVQIANQQQVEALSAELATHDISLADLKSCCEEVVLFGSRAIGEEAENSDWDLFLVNATQEFTAPNFDFISKTTNTQEDSWWKQSELAHHIAEYGVWFKGDGSWVTSLDDQTDAAKRKQLRLKAKLTALLDCWPTLTPSYRMKWRTRIRRDLQRLLKLMANVAVPPSPRLDREFRANPDIAMAASEKLAEQGAMELAILIGRFNELLKAHTSGEQIS